jgi:redox-sensing transcriptional repressor
LVSSKSVERLSLYRRILSELKDSGADNIYSPQLAEISGGTAAQVRRDLMATGYSGSPKMGYQIEELLKGINDFLGPPKGTKAVLVGVGNLGRALLSYFKQRPIGLTIEALFDNSETLTGKTVGKCQCYHVSDMAQVIKDIDARVAVISVPAESAQAVAEDLIAAGIRGIMNFAPVRLHVPENVYVDYVDMTVVSEKVAYFANLNAEKEVSVKTDK